MATATTRAKDPKIVAESQKIFGGIKGIFVGLFFILLALGIFLWAKGKHEQAKAEEAKNPRPAATATIPTPPPAKPDNVTEIIAPVGRYSEKFHVPMNKYFWILPSGKVRIKFSNGIIVDDEPGKNDHLGNMPVADFKITSLEDNPMQVIVVLQ